MTIAAVAAAHIAADLASGGTTSAIDTTGCDLLVWVGGWFNGDPVPADSNSNIWTLIANYNSSGNGNLSIWYAKSPTVGTGHTFTSGTNRSAVAICGFSGTNLTAPYDTPNQAGFPNTFASTVQGGSVTPSAANCLVISGLYFESGTQPSIDSSFTIFDTQLPGNSAVSLAYSIQTTATAVNPTWTCSQQQTRLAAENVSFLPGASTQTSAVSSVVTNTANWTDQAGSTVAANLVTALDGSTTTYIMSPTSPSSSPVIVHLSSMSLPDSASTISLNLNLIVGKDVAAFDSTMNYLIEFMYSGTTTAIQSFTTVTAGLSNVSSLATVTLAVTNAINSSAWIHGFDVRITANST